MVNNFFKKVSALFNFTTITNKRGAIILMLSFTWMVTYGWSLMWEETGVPGGNPLVWSGNHHTISHTAAAEDRTWDSSCEQRARYRLH